jgi:RNA polymerase sigma-70 factor (ECF subfamily)
LIRDQSLAENLVSDVFLKVWREAAEFQGRLRISTWLLSMAHNEALAALGCPQSREPVDRFADVIEDSDDPKTIFLKKDRSSILFPGLVESSEEHREIIDLVYYHGQSLDEVAQILGVARKIVAARMLNARKRMEARLAEAFPN